MVASQGPGGYNIGHAGTHISVDYTRRNLTPIRGTFFFCPAQAFCVASGGALLGKNAQCERVCGR